MRPGSYCKTTEEEEIQDATARIVAAAKETSVDVGVAPVFSQLDGLFHMKTLTKNSTPDCLEFS